MSSHLILVCAIICVAFGHKITLQESMFQGSRSAFPSDLKFLIQTPESMKSVKPVVSSVSSTSQAVMIVTPDEVGPLGNVTVRWKQVSSPTSKDVIAMWCGAQMYPSDYLDALSVNTTSTWKSGFGEIDVVQLIPMRCTYQFAYVRNYDHDIRKQQDIVAMGSVRIAGEPHAPRQGHLSFTQSPEVMSLMYVTGHTNHIGRVQWGLTPSTLNDYSLEISTVSYTAEMMCSATANQTSQQFYRDPGLIHHLRLLMLKPNTQYFYQFGSDEDGWSEVFSFRSAPMLDTVDEVKFLLTADYGYWDTSFMTTKRAVESASMGYDSFMVLFGDISYARSYAWMWDLFFTMLEPLATNVPTMFSIGNHDYTNAADVANADHDPSGYENKFHPWWGNYGSDSHGECSVPIFHRATVPHNGRGIYWYSFDYGIVHVVQMSSEHDWLHGTDQYKWLEKDLKSVDRSKTPWVILTSHRMMYTTQEKEASDYFISQTMRAVLEPLLMKYKVNLMTTGHQHSYERSCPVVKGACVSDGTAPVHMVVGTAGAGLEDAGFSPKLGNWSVAHYDVHGHLRVRANRTHLTTYFVENVQGTVWDVGYIPLWKM